VFLLVPAHPGSPGQRAVKRLLLCCSQGRLAVGPLTNDYILIAIRIQIQIQIRIATLVRRALVEVCIVQVLLTICVVYHCKMSTNCVLPHEAP